MKHSKDFGYFIEKKLDIFAKKLNCISRDDLFINQGFNRESRLLNSFEFRLWR